MLCRRSIRAAVVGGKFKVASRIYDSECDPGLGMGSAGTLIAIERGHRFPDPANPYLVSG